MAIDEKRESCENYTYVNALKASRCALLTIIITCAIVYNKRIVYTKSGRKVQNNDQTFILP